MPSSNQPDVREDEGNTARRKRNRKPVSCAECRRMKLKCDRQVPCSSCSKRGCAELCPNGTLTAGPRNRFVLADTEHLHEKIEMMGQRITELEDALGKLQAQLSNVPHPLLADDLLLVKAPLSTQSAMVTLNEESEEVAKSLGTLTLGDRPRFFGPHAAVDYLFMDYSVDELPASTSSLGADIQLLDMFPMPVTGVARSRVLSQLADCLPPAEQASYIIDRYYSQTSWFFVIISEDELRETIFSRVYGSNGPNLNDVSPHDITILFMILACGHMFDPAHSPVTNDPPDSSSGAKYYQLARVAFSLDSVLDHPTIQAIRALHMMSTFVQMADLPNSPTTCYVLMGLAARLCQCLGLHRDDTQWNIPDSERQNRRRVFWEVASYDLWTSLAYGRPPTFTMAHVDAKVSEEFATDAGENSVLFCSWSHSFTCRVLPKVVDQAFGVASLSYSTVLRLDQLVREHPIPETLRIIDGTEDDPSVPMTLLLQRNSVLSLTQRLILYLHRGFFARALLEHPEDPLKSKYAHSVLAVFRAAVRLNISIRTLYARSPRSLGPESWLFWTLCFSACLVLSSILIKSPGSGLAPPALAELDEMFKFLEQVAPTSPRIMRLMPKIRNLHAKAHETYAAFTATPGYVPPTCTPRSKVDELGKLFFWGPTHLVDNDIAPPRTQRDPTTVSAGLSTVGSMTTFAQSTAADISSSATGPQSLADASMDLSTENPQVSLQTFDDIFGLRPGSWELGRPDTCREAPDSVPHTASGSIPPPGLEDLFSGEFLLAGAPNFDSAMNWIPPDQNPGTGILPPGEHDLAWQRFVSDIALFEKDPQTSGQP